MRRYRLLLFLCLAFLGGPSSAGIVPDHGEIALKQSSAQGGMRVDLPLKDRSLGLHYDWFR